MKNLIALLCILFASLNCFGWGATGHRVTGYIAAKYLNKKAKKEMERILGGQSLAMVATWMDEVRSDTAYDYTADWHWVTIPDGQTYDAAEKNKNGDVIQVIERLIAELKSGKLKGEKEVEAIKMLIHLIGDIHQPLHVGRGTDRGGNNIRVMWFRADSNLHRIWDSDMIDDTKLSYTELGESLRKPSDAEFREWKNTNVRDWANESVVLRDAVYRYKHDKLGYEYSYQNLHLVRQRLLQAGVRIANVLNEIYGK